MALGAILSAPGAKRGDEDKIFFGGDDFCTQPRAMWRLEECGGGYGYPISLTVLSDLSSYFLSDLSSYTDKLHLSQIVLAHITAMCHSLYMKPNTSRLLAMGYELDHPPPSPVRLVTRESRPEKASVQTLAKTALRKGFKFYAPHGNDPTRRELERLNYLSARRALTNTECEWVLNEIKKFRGVK